MSNKGNSGYKGFDGRFTISASTTDTFGHIQREQHFLERTQGRLQPITGTTTGTTVYIPEYINETFERGTFTGEPPEYSWTVVNGSETNFWVVGDDRPEATTGGTYSAYITNGTGTATPSDNVYTDAGGADSHIFMDFIVPTDVVVNPVFGQETMDFSFWWRCLGEDVTFGGTAYDYAKVHFTDTGTTPTAGVLFTSNPIGGGATNEFSVQYLTPQNYTVWYKETYILSVTGVTGGESLRLTWSWHDDAAGGTAGDPPMAIDNIVFGYSALT